MGLMVVFSILEKEEILWTSAAVVGCQVFVKEIVPLQFSTIKVF